MENVVTIITKETKRTLASEFSFSIKVDGLTRGIVRTEQTNSVSKTRYNLFNESNGSILGYDLTFEQVKNVVGNFAITISLTK